MNAREGITKAMNMSRDKYEVLSRLQSLGFTWEQANQLRRISMTLRRWFEMECGTENGAGVSISIERDDNGEGKPFLRRQYMTAQGWVDGRLPIADREAGARKRLAAIMAPFKRRLVAYVQGDPRGCALYILRKQDIAKGENIDSIYNRGVAVY